ncbi:sulfotransferase family cytosolic 2B member 1-like [Tropilaelaps mercedesae]|uniref:Sulfotransferase family cytosolic 2B member 1-like n=1 Tax=Tropilaelaps mercedesae TaxID=418985 RepID=A0A1V9XKQ9_9ACAR|nr:sulfotransferase family cytosolic 2B member 1-like [Tropilaelaps mercedesae]
MRPFYRNHEGLRVPPGVLEKPFHEALAYQPLDDDIFIVTYQKSGTHWASTIVNHILQGPNAQIPPNYLEMYGPVAVNEGHRGMGLRNVIQTHLPVSLIPWNLRARYLMVVRDPKDVVVSLFHHTRNIDLYHYKDGTMDHFFREFVEGRVEYGCYFRALLDYYWLSLRSPNNTLLLTYEAIQANKTAAIRKIANFIGVDLNEQRVHEVVAECAINNVRANCSRKYDSHSATPRANQRIREAYTDEKGRFVPPPPIAFARKGEVGDWRNYLSDQMADMLDARMASMPAGVQALWKGCENTRAALNLHPPVMHHQGNILIEQ